MRLLAHRKKCCWGRKEEGATLLLVAISLVALFALAALAMDIGTAYLHRRRMNIGTDAAALTGIGLLTDPTVPKSEIIYQAKLVGQANGLTSQELAVAGDVQVGRWESVTGLFTPNVQPFNAVSVSAQRSLNLAFAPVIGRTMLSPYVRSLAVYGSPSQALCVIPFAIEEIEVIGHSYGDLLDLGTETPGHWGKLNIGHDVGSADNFRYYMVNGVCDLVVRVGQLITPTSPDVTLGTGYAGVKQGFEERMVVNPLVTVPIVVGLSDSSSGYVEVTGFVVGEIVKAGGKGNKWSGKLRFMDEFTGSGGGGPDLPPYARARILIQ